MTTKTILIVDDDEDVRRSYDIRLKANYYNTYFAADSATCIMMARKYLPDLILLDLGLPGGDGFVVMERLKVNMNLTGIPIIIVTARDPYPNRDRALRSGAKAFLQKPVDNDELLAVIQQQLAETSESKKRQLNDAAIGWP